MLTYADVCVVNRDTPSMMPLDDKRRKFSQELDDRSSSSKVLAYVSIRQHTSAYVSIRQHKELDDRSSSSKVLAYVSIRQHMSAYVSIRNSTTGLPAPRY